MNSLARVTKSPSEAARSLLVETYNLLKVRTGKPPTRDAFFPVPLDTIVLDVLGWHLDRVASVGQVQTVDASGESEFDPTHGVTDFEKSVITIGVDNISREQQRFTLAHEIGHVQLHANLRAVAMRVRPVRRAVGVPQDRTAWKMERDADVFATELMMPRKAMANLFRECYGRPSMSAPVAIQVVRGDSPAMWEVNNETLKKASELLAMHRSNAASPSMAAYFGVSAGAMARRLRELGLITI